MINNRQAGRRNRGRNNNNNGRPNNNQSRGGGDTGNRIDNRARGNATQLLEKYRNMARDSQLSGDRVSTEYYLQFADHYFRVLADNRARQEEAQSGGQQPMRPRAEPTYDEFGDEYDTGDISNGGNIGNGNGGDYDDRPQIHQQPQRESRDNGRGDNGQRDGGQRDGGQRDGGQRDNSQRDNNQRDGGQQREQRQPYQNRDENRGNEARRNDYRNDARNEGRNDARSDIREDGRDRQPPRRDTPRREAPVVQDVSGEEPPAVAIEPAAEAPRRRGRPPKNRDVAPEATTREAPAAPVEGAEASASRRGLRQRPPRAEADDGNGGGLDLAVLPPAIARTEADNDSVSDTEAAPRKRIRRVRPAAGAAE